MVKNITFLKLSCRKIVKLYFKIVPFQMAQLAIAFLPYPLKHPTGTTYTPSSRW